MKAIGVDGFAGELANTAAGAAIGQIVINIANGAQLFAQVNPAMLANAAGGFLGSYLAAKVVSFDSIGGQIGSSVGAAVGGIVAASALATGGSLASLGAQLGILAGSIGAFAGAFLGFIVGGLIGSVFGGTPRAGADVEHPIRRARTALSGFHRAR